MRRSRRAFLSLGSNLGDRWSYLRGALDLLPDITSVSSVYETEPVGGPPGQGRYLNMVAQLQTALEPRQLLEVAQAAEKAAGRERKVRWGPRTLDVDILVVGDLRADEPDLVVPHPRMWQRGFVLVPLAEIAPDIVGDRLTAELAGGVVLAGTIW
ncbi:MAG: 2-amino-4-hydroxy-6-hydroxymethyldihydropteridine diphosphokinase [Acidimicrobiales bacterium]